MDGKKVLEEVGRGAGIYRSFLSGIPKKDFPNDQFVSNKHDVLAHCHMMLDEMDKFMAEGKMDKVFGRLEFIQGCLWSLGYYDLSELKNHYHLDLDSEEHIERGRE